MIPQLNGRGLLPVGKHKADWKEFVARFAHTDARRVLVGDLRLLILTLGALGCRAVWIGGSFVSSKEPSDLDAAIVADGSLPWLTPGTVIKDRLGIDLYRHDHDFAGRSWQYLLTHMRDGDEVGVIVLDPQEVAAQAPLRDAALILQQRLGGG